MVRQKYRFMLDSVDIRTRGRPQPGAICMAATVAVAGQPPITKTCTMDHPNSGFHNPRLTFDEVVVRDDQAVAFCYLVINSQYPDTRTVEREMEEAVSALGSSAAQADAQSIGAGSGAAIGASIGTAAVPLIGSALGALTGWIGNQVGSVLVADDDGPVAAGMHPFMGADLRAQAQHGPCRAIDSNSYPRGPHGCGRGSGCDVGWSVESIPGSSLSVSPWNGVWIKPPKQPLAVWGCVRQSFDKKEPHLVDQLDY